MHIICYFEDRDPGFVELVDDLGEIVCIVCNRRLNRQIQNEEFTLDEVAQVLRQVATREGFMLNGLSATWLETVRNAYDYTNADDE
jgi:hypothetical protein